jgi:hypothetical protein
LFSGEALILKGSFHDVPSLRAIAREVAESSPPLNSTTALLDLKDISTSLRMRHLTRCGY